METYGDFIVINGDLPSGNLYQRVCPLYIYITYIYITYIHIYIYLYIMYISYHQNTKKCGNLLFNRLFWSGTKKTSLSEWILNPDGYLPKNDRSNAMALKQFKFYGKSNGLDLKSLERKLSNDLYNAWWNCCSIPILCSWNILILVNIHDIDADTYSSANRHSGVIIYMFSRCV